MKIYIILILLILLSTSVNAQIDGDSFAKLIGTDPAVEINLGKTMLGLLSSATGEEEGVTEILSALSSINVIVFELENIKKIKSIKSEINSIVKNKVIAGYEKLATIKEEDSLVYVLAKMDDKKLKNLSIFALDDEDELVLIEINGSILISQIGTLMEHFDVDLDINGMKFNNQNKKQE